jgi:hypothetical protein
VFQAPSCYHFVGELGTSEVPDDVGQRDGSEQAPTEHQAESSVTGGSSSIPSITVTRAAEEAGVVTEIEEMPPPQLAGIVTTVIKVSVIQNRQNYSSLYFNVYVFT